MKLLVLIPALFIIMVSLNFFSPDRIVLAIGDIAPSFTLSDQDGKAHNLSDYKGKKIVVYFFPMADTPGWIKEACGFRNIYSEFEKNNIIVLGISYDKTKTLRDFKDKYNLPFDFLSDSTKSVALSYGANGIFAPKRMTFIIDSDLKIEKIYNEINVNTHAEKILTDLTR